MRLSPVLIALLTLSAAAWAETEEQRLVRISKKLTPISDAQWNEIAAGKTSEVYEIHQGDTLWDVSRRLFGDSKYWPKIWSLNAGITNPHIVDPGQKLAFTPGSSESLPQLAPTSQESQGAESNAGATDQPQGKRAAREYDRVSQDLWAPLDLSRRGTQNYDEYGLDRNLKVEIPRQFAFRVPVIANDTTVPYLGEITGSRRDGVGLGQQDLVFIKSVSQDLQVGITYSVLSAPDFVRDRKSDRSGYIYRSLAEILIVGIKDEVYVGQITKSYDAVERGDKLYPLLPIINAIEPQAAREQVEAVVIGDPNEYSSSKAQYQFIHFDRGIEDGVQVGNVFRIYEYYDPITHDKVTDSDFLMFADALIVHATAEFSTGMILRSRDPIVRGQLGVLLTDVSDFVRKEETVGHALGEEDKRSAEDKELDELDELDRKSGEGLGTKEEQEIKELDNWDKTHEEPAEKLKSEPEAVPEAPQEPEATPDVEAQPPAGESEATIPSEAVPSGEAAPGATQATPPPASVETLPEIPASSGGSGMESAPSVEPAQPAPSDDVPASQ